MCRELCAPCAPCPMALLAGARLLGAVLSAPRALLTLPLCAEAGNGLELHRMKRFRGCATWGSALAQGGEQPQFGFGDNGAGWHRGGFAPPLLADGLST